MRKIKKRLGGDHICTTGDIMEGLPLEACTEFAVPEVHFGVFMDEGCAISKAYWEWKKTGEVAGLEEVGRAMMKIMDEPVDGPPNSPADKEQLVDGKTRAVAGRDRRQVLEAAGLLGISAFGIIIRNFWADVGAGR